MSLRFLLVFDNLLFYLGQSGGHLLGKTVLLALLFYFMPSKICVFLSHLVSRACCGIRLYRFLIIAFSSTLLIEPRHEKTCIRGLRPGKTQTGLLSYRDQLESWNFGFSKYRYCTIQVANNKGADQTALMRRLICAFVVRIWQNRVSHDVAQLSSFKRSISYPVLPLSSTASRGLSKLSTATISDNKRSFVHGGWSFFYYHTTTKLLSTS